MKIDLFQGSNSFLVAFLQFSILMSETQGSFEIEGNLEVVLLNLFTHHRCLGETEVQPLPEPIQ